METRSSGRFFLVTILCLATGGFGYAMGRQSGEEVGRDKTMVHFNDARAAAMSASFRAEKQLEPDDEPAGEEFATHHAAQDGSTAHASPIAH